MFSSMVILPLFRPEVFICFIEAGPDGIVSEGHNE